MSDERVSEPVKPRTCGQCGRRMPPQKRGRPRKWCSQQCRQLAYEERNGLPSWKDRQPKAGSLSDVVEVMQDRSARREAIRVVTRRRGPAEHSFGDCLAAVCRDQILLGMVIDAVTEQVLDGSIANDADGRFLANRVMHLANALGVLPDRPEDEPYWQWGPVRYS